MMRWRSQGVLVLQVLGVADQELDGGAHTAGALAAFVVVTHPHENRLSVSSRYRRLGCRRSGQAHSTVQLTDWDSAPAIGPWNQMPTRYSPGSSLGRSTCAGLVDVVLATVEFWLVEMKICMIRVRSSRASHVARAACGETDPTVKLPKPVVTNPPQPK